MTDNTSAPLKWSVRNRLEFIEFRLFWEGRLNRSALADAFGISAQQASTDLAQYQQIAPANLAYDGNIKAYVRSGGFEPVLMADSADRNLLQLVAMQSGWMRREETWFDALPSYEVVSLRRRPTDARTLLAVLDAIREKQEIGIDYQSMTGSPQSWRKVAPHALAYSAGRWYVRVWSREHNDFRDYNLSKIRSVGSKSRADVDYSLDYEWHQKIDLIVAPNPQLSSARQQAVASEYNMTDNQLALPIRLSLSFYLMSEHNLDVAPGVLAPEKQQIVLTNRTQVEQARALSREMSKQALVRYLQERQS